MVSKIVHATACEHAMANPGPLGIEHLARERESAPVFEAIVNGAD